jgi:hypothetical protein
MKPLIAPMEENAHHQAISLSATIVTEFSFCFDPGSDAV